MITTIILVVCGLMGYSMGKTSNGMTSPRQAFNIYTGPFMAILGAGIGAVGALVVGSAIASGALAGLACGFVAGLVGLVLARLKRNR